MSFKQRQINVVFNQPSGYTLSLEGIMASALIHVPGGSQVSAMLQMQVWGMTLAQMNRLSSVGTQMAALTDTNVTVFAGEVGGQMSVVFMGGIYRAFMDFTSIPDVAFTIAAVTGLYHRGKASSPNAYSGAHSAEDLIKALASSIGFGFVNAGGAHAVLRDQYLYGSVVQQMESVAYAANFPMELSNDTVTIWPNKGYRDGVVIPVGAETGMVGYPTYYEVGFMVQTLFNPAIQFGRQVQVTSTIPKANGIWPVQGVTHELTTQQPDGPWFTNAVLSPLPYKSQNG